MKLEKENQEGDDIAEAIGQDAPPEEEAESKESDPESEEDSEKGADSKTESDSEESEESEDEESEESSEEEESEEEKSEDKEDTDDEDKEDEEDKEPRSSSEKTKEKGHKSIRVQISELQDTMAKILEGQQKGTKIEETIEESEKDVISEETLAAAKELSKASKIPETVLAKILHAASKLSASGKLPKDAQETIDALTKDKKDGDEIAHFNKEWDSLTIQLKKKFPNASDSQLQEAKEVMDDIAHEKRHQNHDLDYVLFKNGKKFGVILGGKTGKSGETGKTINRDELDEEDDGKVLDIEDMTPEIARKQQKKSNAHQKEKPYKVLQKKERT